MPLPPVAPEQDPMEDYGARILAALDELPHRAELKSITPAFFNRDPPASPEGAAIAIDYVNFEGLRLRRLITIHEVNDCYVDAYCHERKADRTFRIDRIRAVIDGDGVVHDPFEFFKYTPPPPDVEEKPGLLHRTVARPGLVLLCALHRIDNGHRDRRKLAVILDYVAARVARAGIEMSKADRTAVRQYAARHFPSPYAVQVSLKRSMGAPDVEREALLRAAIDVMNADGQQTTREVAFVRRLQELLTD